jgi:hypothetical protein
MTQPLGSGAEEAKDRQSAFSRLDEQQRARLRALRTVRNVETGEVLFHAGPTD